MNRKLLSVAAAALLSVPALAQDIKVYDTGRKWSGALDGLIDGQSAQRFTARGVKAVTPESLISVSVSVTDTAAVADFVRSAGYEAEAVTGGTVVVSIPALFVKTLAERDDVLFVNEPRQFRPFMANVRPETGVEKVQAGEGLDTPFDGSGVIVAVIDQGFEYRHPAFSGRVKKYGASTTSGTLRDTAPSRDALDDVGHATHVTNIAAGNKISGSEYYGIATGADLVLISSDFADASVLRQTKAIKDYANGEGKPWVLNMSFGASLGPHDGTTSFDQSMSAFSEAGGIMVAAMGNDGGYNCHAERDFSSDDETIYLNAQPNSYYNPDGVLCTEVWGKATDGVQHLEITPVLFYNNRFYEATAANLRSAGFSVESGINAYNNRQQYTIRGYLPQLATVLGITARNGYYFLWRVKGNTGEGFHAWTDPNTGYTTFDRLRRGSVSADAGDDEYIVGEGGASVPKAVAVSSYNAATTINSLQGGTLNYSSNVGVAGGFSAFSSKGPQLNDLPKPAIAAPGGVVVSAYSKNADDFSTSKDELVQRVSSGGASYYYCVMSGTSMASPVVTGVVALWLQANPTLTYDQVIEIMKQTGRHDSFTGSDTGWNASWGYGKIDAYEGLKKALEMAQASGINQTLNTEAPVTLQKGSDAWKVLFNNDESYADIRLYSLNGALVQSLHADAPRRGEERVVSLAGLQPGVYLFRVQTTAGSLTRKLVVR